MKLRVTPEVPIPHTVLIAGEAVVFSPDAEVPNEWGESRKKHSPHIYIDAKGEPDLSKYRVMEISLVKSLHEKFDALESDEKAATLKYMEGLVEKRKAKAAAESSKKEHEDRKALRQAAEDEAKAKKEGRA
jgi:hypothetical protein